MSEIKSLLNQQFDGESYQQPKIEVIQDEPQEKQNYDLILKPFTDRINQLEIVENKYISLVEESATLKERVKNKDEIITFLQERLNRLEAKKWYQVWK